MAKGNDKKVVRHTRDLLVTTMSNLLESHRERQYRQGKNAKSRAAFCADHHLVESTVAHIETGRFLDLNFSQLRTYLAAIYGRHDAAFTASARKVYDGLKELDALLEEL